MRANDTNMFLQDYIHHYLLVYRVLRVVVNCNANFANITIEPVDEIWNCFIIYPPK